MPGCPGRPLRVDIDTAQGHFVTMLASCWDDALIAGVPPRLELWDGSVREGEPSVPAHRHDMGATELDHTGVATEVELGGVRLCAADVRAYTATLGDEHRPTGAPVDDGN